MSVGRLEGRITFSSAQEMEYTDSNGGPVTITVAAGNYYPTDLCAELQTQIQAAAGSIGSGLTVTLSRGESGATGRVTIAISSGQFSLTWTSTNIRDALGFTADIVDNTTDTSANHAKALWIPGNPAKFSMYGDGAGGSYVTDLAVMIGPTGVANTLYGNKYRVHRGIRWVGVPAARAMAHHETITGESFEAFFNDCALGRVSYIPVGTYVRLIWNAGTDGTYATGKLAWSPELDLEQYIRGHVGRYNVELPPLVVES